MHASLICLYMMTISFLVATPVFAKPPAKASTALADYVANEDDSFRWTKRREGAFGAGRITELILTSQTWRDIVWKHQLFIYRPSRVDSGAQALLFIGGGAWDEKLEEAPVTAGIDNLPKEAHILAGLAETLQAPVAVLLQVPQQPIFDGMFEDEIISFTFAKFIETGDAEWPLLLPMVKSSVRAMDAIQEFARQEWQHEIESFFLTGASKRGWTTWLTSAIDSRVNALAPLVINMLNMGPHLELQRESFGGSYSDEIRDYTEKGLAEQLESDRGELLQAIVDPYCYRQLIQQPKLIVLGTNDAYWPVDSLNLYWKELEGEKYIVYAPNEGHGMRDYPRVLGAMAALFQSSVNGTPLPKLEWRFEDEEDRVLLHVSSDREPVSVTVWSTTAESRDFRRAEWTSRPATTNGEEGHHFVIEAPKPVSGYSALFAEAQFNGESMPYYLSTDLRVISSNETAGEAD